MGTLYASQKCSLRSGKLGAFLLIAKRQTIYTFIKGACVTARANHGVVLAGSNHRAAMGNLEMYRNA